MTIKLNQPYSFCQLGKRANQEDSRYPNSNMPADYAPFFIVCDGVGGNVDGEVASMAVCEGLGKALRQFDWNQAFTQEHLRQAIAMAYQALDKAAEHGSTDMATTLVLVCFHREGCMMAHIGDSRIYQIRPSQGIVYRSDDHSLINSLVHAGLVAPEEALTHPERSTINRYLAPLQDDEERYEATCFQTTDIEAGDYFFLCSDGVTGIVDEQTLETVICSDGTDEEKCQAIASLSQDSQDNNTAFLISVAEVVRDTKDSPAHTEDDTEDDYASHDTRPSIQPRPVAENMEAQNPDWGHRIMNYFKKILN